MPSPKKCGAKFPKESQAYKDCVNYKGVAKKPANKPMKKGY